MACVQIIKRLRLETYFQNLSEFAYFLRFGPKFSVIYPIINATAYLSSFVIKNYTQSSGTIIGVLLPTKGPRKLRSKV